VANRTKPSGQGGVLEKSRKDRRRGRGWCSPAVTESTDDDCRPAEVRREIPRRLVDVSERDQREMREGFLGYL
jgi:hypothetical protein